MFHYDIRQFYACKCNANSMMGIDFAISEFSIIHRYIISFNLVFLYSATSQHSLHTTIVDCKIDIKTNLCRESRSKSITLQTMKTMLSSYNRNGLTTSIWLPDTITQFLYHARIWTYGGHMLFTYYYVIANLTQPYVKLDLS